MSLLAADCAECGYHQRLFADILRSYKLDAQTNVTIPVAYGWCDRCASVTAVEALPTLEKIDSDIEFFAHHFLSEDLQNLRDNQRNLRQWRVNRIGAAKCLECGSTKLEVFKEVEDLDEHDTGNVLWHPLIHPKCGGKLSLRDVGFSRTMVWVFYTPDGDKIGTYDVHFSRGLVRRIEEV